MTEIAYSRSGFIRLVKIDNVYQLELKNIRGQSKLGSLIFWKKVCGVYDREKAISLLENY